MALQTSGAISLNQIHIEAGGSSGTQASLNDSDIRGLISKGSGAQMSFSEWYGASNTFSFSITSSTTNASLSTLATNAGWNGSSAIDVTINSGVNLIATSTSNYGLNVNVSNSIVRNSGRILGKGGNGGGGSGGAGSAGGHALRISNPGCTVINNSGGYIYGGGGGGGGGLGSGGNARTGGGGGAGGGTGGSVPYGAGGSGTNTYGAGGGAGGGQRGGPGGNGGGGAGGYEWGNRERGGGGGGGRKIGGGDVRRTCANPAWNGTCCCFAMAYGRGGTNQGQDTTDGGGGGGGGGYGAAGGRGGLNGDTSTRTSFSARGAAGRAVSAAHPYSLTNNGNIAGAT